MEEGVIKEYLEEFASTYRYHKETKCKDWDTVLRRVEEYEKKIAHIKDKDVFRAIDEMSKSIALDLDVEKCLCEFSFKSGQLLNCIEKDLYRNLEKSESRFERKELLLKIYYLDHIKAEYKRLVKEIDSEVGATGCRDKIYELLKEVCAFEDNARLCSALFFHNDSIYKKLQVYK